MTLFPVHYGGSIGYYQHLLHADEVMFEIHEHFIKQTHRNRIEVFGPNGVQKLVIPTKKTGQRRVAGEVEISFEEPWQRAHWKGLEAAYNRSPYFEYYQHEFYPFYHSKTTNLYDFNFRFMATILRLINIELKSERSTEYLTDVENDLRKSNFPMLHSRPYIQVFEDRHEFVPNLSILDALFNLGPMTKDLIVPNK